MIYQKVLAAVPWFSTRILYQRNMIIRGVLLRHNFITSKNYNIRYLHLKSSILKTAYGNSNDKVFEETLEKLYTIENMADSHFEDIRLTMSRSAFWPVQLLSMLIHSDLNENKIKIISALLDYVNSSSHMSHLCNNKTLGLLYALFLSKQGFENEAFKVLNEKWGEIEILDKTSGNLIVEIYSYTSKWREAFDIMKLVDRTSNIHIPLIRAAVLENDEETLFRLLNMFSNESIRDERYSNVLINILESYDQDINFLNRFLLMLRERSWYVSKQVAERIRCNLEKCAKEKWIAKYSTVSFKGKCLKCGFQMDPLPAISDEDFSKLTSEFMNKSLVGNDIFYNTSPQELKRFINFLNIEGKFDMVIDSLNIGFASAYGRLDSNLVSKVVQYMAIEKKMKVLLLGRKHVMKWPKKHLEPIQCHASLFLTHNQSQDDPFMLYAAFKSGKHAMICTADFLRKESVLLGPELRPLFVYWQRGHQVKIVVTDRNLGKFNVIWPDEHNMNVHRTGKSWHIPYLDSDQQLPVYKVPYTLICAQKSVL